MTIGMMMFYGGIMGAVVFGLLAIIMIPVFRRQRKKLLDRIYLMNAGEDIRRF